MRIRFWKTAAPDTSESELKAAAASDQLDEARSNWAQVRDDSTWAKSTRERNHLTAMFYDGLQRGNS